MNCEHENVKWDPIESVGFCPGCGGEYDVFHMTLMSDRRKLKLENAGFRELNIQLIDRIKELEDQIRG